MAAGLIAAKVVGSIVKEKVDRKYFGGALGRSTHLINNALFLYKLHRALTLVKKGSGKSLADEVADAVRQAVPVRTGTLRDSVRVIERKDGIFTVIVGGTPETMKPFRGGAVTFDLALGTEYGTTKGPAHPFFWPTVQPFQKRIEKSLGGAIEQEFG